jgi:hypothetical protein
MFFHKIRENYKQLSEIKTLAWKTLLLSRYSNESPALPAPPQSGAAAAPRASRQTQRYSYPTMPQRSIRRRALAQGCGTCSGTRKRRRRRHPTSNGELCGGRRSRGDIGDKVLSRGSNKGRRRDGDTGFRMQAAGRRRRPAGKPATRRRRRRWPAASSTPSAAACRPSSGRRQSCTAR